MTLTYYGYPKCGTCRKAKKWLDEQGIDYTDNNIAETPPSAEQLKEYIQNSGLPLKKFFNTSGLKYKELNLKDKLPTMSDEEQIQLLASDGMLIKRPIVSDGKKVTVGFKENEFEEAWSR
ncbi:arsenate reductase family protein [Chungangia koreensis]|uniref:Arsenate reductase family protein n=1 Tax=Chungangia koreensis TaxID=752657 RepID=A0ABV8X728_9LACT